ncbi:hypothetical protein VCR15J2_390034 [Vibrio coralliirubri]|uniref:replication initiation protein n=1 Tax=Vibrio coralliirubri TaxID=1516159 RepID=UPI000630F3D0|nr:replication initiation protein [Vibrio coralliirubri]CDT52988.1 hypothetical protein VCR15J2_390034 [Vibrio coralliirubri]
MKKEVRNITQANELIEAAFDLKLQELRLILFALSTVQDLKEHDLYFEISPPDFARAFKINQDRSYGELRKAVNGIRDKKLWIYNEEDGSKADINWVTARIQHRTGTVTLKLNHDLRPFFQMLLHDYTAYGLEYVTDFQKKYSYRFYQLFKQHEKLGRRKMELGFIRERLMLGASYNAFKFLRSKILEPCIKEINDTSDIFVTYEPIKQGRSVVALEFKIGKNKKNIEA